MLWAHERGSRNESYVVDVSWNPKDAGMLASAGDGGDDEEVGIWSKIGLERSKTALTLRLKDKKA